MLDREEISNNLDIEDINHINRSIFNGKKKRFLNRKKYEKVTEIIKDDYKETISFDVLNRMRNNKKEKKVQDFYEFQDYEVHGLFLN